MPKQKVISISISCHRKLVAEAKKSGMKIGRLADKIISEHFDAAKEKSA